MHGNRGEERRRGPLSDEQMEAIAARAAEIALDAIYSDVGKGVVKRVAWAIGLGVVMLFGYLVKRGHIPL